jgi:hypothetical protein
MGLKRIHSNTGNVLIIIGLLSVAHCPLQME